MRTIMIVVAVLTVIVGGTLLIVGHWAAREGGEPMPRSMRRNTLILTAAGPVNLLVWYLFNGLIEGIGARSVVGYVLAALVFIGAGFSTGFFGRVRERMGKK